MNIRTLEHRLHDLEKKEAVHHVRYVMAHPGVDVEAEIAKIEAEDPDAEVTVFRWLDPEPGKGLKHANDG